MSRILAVRDALSRRAPCHFIVQLSPLTEEDSEVQGTLGAWFHQFRIEATQNAKLPDLLFAAWAGVRGISAACSLL